jgi:hypothetical protein
MPDHKTDLMTAGSPEDPSNGQHLSRADASRTMSAKRLPFET